MSTSEHTNLTSLFCWQRRSWPIACAILILTGHTISNGGDREIDRPGIVWDLADNSEKVIWRTDLPGRARSLTQSEGVTLVGTSDSNANPNLALLIGLSSETGKQLWQIKHQRLPNRINDLPGAPIASTPFVDKDRAYYISNRGELCCILLQSGKPVWTLDMRKELKVFKRDPNDIDVLVPSPVVDGNSVYTVTGNGRDSDGKVPSPDAPSFLSVDKLNGKVNWSSNAPGNDIIYGQWSTPGIAHLSTQSSILMPGGDGYLYGFNAAGKQLWKIDCKSKNKNLASDFIVAPLLVDGGIAFVGLNRDFEQGHGIPHAIQAVDIAKSKIRLVT